MEQRQDALAASFRALIEDARSRAPSHPTHDELTDYSLEDLTFEEQEKIKDHLAICPQCVKSLQELRTATAARPSRRPSVETTEALWTSLRETSGLFAAPSRWQRLVATLTTPRFAYAVVAVLCLAVGVLSFQLASLRRTALPDEPLGSVFLSDLVPYEGALREPESEETTRVPPGSDHFLWILNLADTRSYPNYQVEIADPDGRIRWRNRALERGPFGNFTLQIPRSFLPTGRYRITIYGVEQDLVELATYRVRLEYE